MGYASTFAENAKDFDPAGHYYVLFSDGCTAGTEACWLPQAKRWVWYDGDRYEISTDECLTLIFSAEDVDESGLNRLGEPIAINLHERFGLWVVPGEASGLSGLPGDAEVYEWDENGLREVELMEEERE